MEQGLRRLPLVIRGVLAAGVLAAGVLGAGCSRSKGEAPGGGGFEMPPMPVETATAVRGTVTERLDAVGTIEASKAVSVVAEVDGRVVDIPFHEGQAISRGDLIARLDDDQLRAEVDRATALRDQSRLSFQRVEVIVEQKAAAPQDLDDARASLQVAEANLALAEARLAKTRITAPFSGVVGARQVSPGEYVQPGRTITDIADLHEIRVSFSAPERYLSQLQRGAEVSISTTAYPDMPLVGRIVAVEPILDPGTRSAGVVAIVPNAEGRLRSGMSANVSAVLAQRPNAITIPSEAVFFEGDQALVFVVKPDGSVARTPVTLGTRLPEAVEVIQGLEPGVNIVRSGHQKLFEGAKVMPIGAGAPGGAAAGDTTGHATPGNTGQ